MGSNLQAELQQSVPFASMKEELWLNLLRTTAQVGHVLEQKLRPYGLSATQYNVLRILRGAGEKGLCQYEIRNRLVAQVPDVPRILDRMEKAGWIQRVRATGDKRMVLSTLCPKGLELGTQLDAPMLAMLAQMFPELDDEAQQRLNELLVLARKAC